MDGQKSFKIEDIVTLKQFASAESMRKKNNPFYCERTYYFPEGKMKKHRFLANPLTIIIITLCMSGFALANQPPIANAGLDQVVYVGASGKAEITLDGTSSYDPDGDALTYMWILNGSEIASGAIATIELATGQYTIGLIVNDGIVDSAPDEVVINVLEPTPIDDLVVVSSGLVSYDRRTGQFSTQITVKNKSETEIGEPVWLVIENISKPAVTLAGVDGMTADGKPYFDLSNLLGDGKLSPGETISRRVYFNNPNRLKFTFTPSVRGVVPEEEEPPGGPS